MLVEQNNIENDNWEFLKKHTAARIALGHAGVSIPTNELLKFRLAHAQARDAVYSELDLQKISSELELLKLPYLTIKSSASSRNEYLSNPSTGKTLTEDAPKLINAAKSKVDLCIVIADGLSAKAVNNHAVEVIHILTKKLAKLNWTIAPIVLAKQARVALSDEIGSSLKADIILMLIGERPGLSSPDSMGAYITYEPKPGLTDERRNCVSNIRPEGLTYNFAAEKLFYLLTEMKTRKISGVKLKDRQDGLFLG